LGARQRISSQNHIFDIKECEYYDVEGHDIDHCYSLHSKFCLNKSTNNKDGKNMKKGLEVSNSSQFKGKAISKAQVNSMIKAKVLMWPLHKINLLGWRN
jgi:hypothetical protein